MEPMDTPIEDKLRGVFRRALEIAGGDPDTAIKLALLRIRSDPAVRHFYDMLLDAAERVGPDQERSEAA